MKKIILALLILTIIIVLGKTFQRIVLCPLSIDSEVLKEEAPETLIEPKREQFINKEYYKVALQKFKVCGHWATPVK